ncbi:unnamed protein product [Rhizoctonia solani]|uniref:DASH complex subunit ASK1 n=1 Tax=Rhizoctonia solani TaxID=456999 RepID=A0A8H2X273_9AGAM|nr:unnamed protein product [Rhizoctonia solani]
MPEDALDASWQPTPDPRDIVIPGVDPDLPITVQTEQIDQLITLKLQNIDKNFAKCHQIITTKILPSLKKYSAGSQPTRDAAKFWRGFFEAAAQIRVSVEEEGVSTLGERTPHEASEDANRTAQPAQVYHDETTDGSDITFRRGAVSSTPQVQKFSHVADSVERSVNTNDSWVERSVESPFERFDRQLKDLAFEDDQDTQSSVQSVTAPTAGAPRGGKPLPIPQFESEESSISSHNMSSQQPSTSSSSIMFAIPDPTPQPARTAPSPKGKNRRKSAGRDLRHEVLKTNLMNTAKPGSRWNGITDLRSNASTSEPTVSTLPDESFEDEVTHKPHIPLQPYSPTRNRETLQRTPSKQAAAMLVRNALSRAGGSDRSITSGDASAISSVAPSTSSSTRNYGAAQSSVSSASTLGSKPNPIPGLFGLSPEDLQGSSLFGGSKLQQSDSQPGKSTGPSKHVYAEESPLKWQDDSGLVSAASYHIPRHIDTGEDESFDRSRSTDSSFDNDETEYGGYNQPRWTDDGDQYSSGEHGFEEDDETIFGARRVSSAPVQAGSGGAAIGTRPSNMFALPDVTATYYGGRLEDAAGEESPTPWARSAAGRGR